MTAQQNVSSPRVLFQLFFFILLIPFLPLLITRRWGWWEAWAFALLYILSFAVSRLLAARRHPDLIAERARLLWHEDAKPWDKRLAPLVGIGGGLVPLVAGLDVLFGCSPATSFPLKIASLVVMLAGYVLACWALIENRFFSVMVRIQTERGHRVVSSGPYRWIRHPGYAGGLLTYLTIPCLLDSLWAFLPALALTILLVLRTSLEDRTLQDELEGYRDYTRGVRYRLLPGVW